jgi:hypothetical protein
MWSTFPVASAQQSSGKLPGGQAHQMAVLPERSEVTSAGKLFKNSINYMKRFLLRSVF